MHRAVTINLRPSSLKKLTDIYTVAGFRVSATAGTRFTPEEKESYEAPRVGYLPAIDGFPGFVGELRETIRESRWKEREVSPKLEKEPPVIRAAPMVANDPGTSWRHLSTLNGELAETVFPNVYTLDELWKESVRRYGDADCLGSRRILASEIGQLPDGKPIEKLTLGNYEWLSFNEVSEMVRDVGAGLQAIGHSSNERLVIFAETRAEWLITALACFRKGFTVATVYSTLGEEAITHAINECEATTIVTSHSLLDKMQAVIGDCNSIRRVVFFDSPQCNANANSRSEQLEQRCDVVAYSDLIEKGKANETAVDAQPNPDDVAVIMYTSGTTGVPKGVMISHRNIVAALAGQIHRMGQSSSDTVISYLPLAHIFEMCVELSSLAAACRIGYASPLTLVDGAPKLTPGCPGDARALQPTFMPAVPAILDRIHQAVMDKISMKPPIVQDLLKMAFERKARRFSEGKPCKILDKLIFSKIQQVLGGKLLLVLSGGAPLSQETWRFMNTCFGNLVQGYGLTETCAGTSISQQDEYTIGSVGPPISTCEIRLREWKEGGYSPYNELPQGEILVGGKNVVLGYFKNEAKTKEDFLEIDGQRYFATGDIGEIHQDGTLRIIDRKKDLLKLSDGEYIAPSKIELALTSHSCVDTVCIYGRSQYSYLVALVVPNQANLRKLAQQIGVTDSKWADICNNELVKDAVLRDFNRHVRGKLQKAEIPTKIHLCSEPWTPLSGLLTEALKLKRRNIENAFIDVLDDMYSS